MPVIILPPIFSHPRSPLVKSFNNWSARACRGPLVRPPTSSERVPITNWPVGDTIPSHLRVCFLGTTPSSNHSKSGSLETDGRWRLARKGLIGISVTTSVKREDSRTGQKGKLNSYAFANRNLSVLWKSLEQVWPFRDVPK